MSESRWISVYNEVDVINARMQTRQMAKEAGLQIMDQARISLAVSSVAHVIRLGEACPGQIVINRLVEDGRSGVQVVWMIKAGEDLEQLLRALDDSSLQLMVDKMDIQSSPTTGLCITAVKWTGPIAGQHAPDGSAGRREVW